jgi:hypothetical protein
MAKLITWVVLRLSLVSFEKNDIWMYPPWGVEEYII